MGRIYYDKDRIMSQVSEDGDDSKIKDYTEKIIKFIPSEIIAAYLTVVGLVPSIQGIDAQMSYLIIYLIFLLITTWYVYILRDKTEPIPIPQMVISTIAFIVWGFATTGDKIFPSWHQPAIASIVLIIFTLISGKIPTK